MQILVTGASRGIGRGIAIELALNGHNVYITGRNQKTLDQVNQDAAKIAKTENYPTFKNITSLTCDHSNDDEVEQVFNKIPELDCLVNNAYSGVNAIMEANQQPFFQLPITMWDELNNVGLRNNYRCCHHAVRKMMKINSSQNLSPNQTATDTSAFVERRNAKKPGFIINISSAGGAISIFNAAYGIGKEAKDRMMVDFGIELAKHKTNIFAISLWPGAVKTETIMEQMEKDSSGNLKRIFQNGESTRFAGRCLAAVFDKMGEDNQSYVKFLNGGIVTTSDIGNKYNLKDVDNRVIPSTLGLNGILYAAGFRRAASWIPGWCKVPKWVFALGTYGKRLR